jgi:plastocyanin
VHFNLSERFAAGILVACAWAVLQGAANAQGVSGTILIKKKLTRPSVTPSVSVYQRGPAVKLGNDAEDDPIAFERSRVVVYLEGPAAAEGAGEPAAAPVEVQQRDRRFVPDLVVVPVGSTVSFPNMDPIFHNIYSLSKAKSFDLGSYDKGQTRRVTFQKPGIVEVYCHLHPNMAATVMVTPNRWYARPDRTGHYQIPDVPPGQYTVVAWHKSAGFFRKTIVVGEGHEASADFFIPVDSDTKQLRTANDDNGARHGEQD